MLYPICSTPTKQNNPNSKKILERQAKAIDSQIDAIVYSLYDLNEDEIKIVEGS